MQEIVLVTNIPTPYRTPLYDALQRAFADAGYAFEVWYMARNEPNRHWYIDITRLHHKHRFFKGLHLTVKGRYIHFNPGISLQMLRKRRKILILGGGIQLPDFWLGVLIGRAEKKLAWIESNQASEKISRGWIKSFKSRLLRKMDGFVVPGINSSEYVRGMDDRMSEHLYYLPNTINEQLVTPELKSKVLGRKQLWLCVARLSPEKNLLRLVQAIEGLPLRLIIAGEGPQRAMLEQLIAKKGADVTLTGHLTEQELIQFYRQADVFVLPSLKDPSPLAAVEAAAWGIPLLLSENVGNAVELLDGHASGWTFSPEKTDNMRAVFMNVAQLERPQLQIIGIAAQKIYQERFALNGVVDRFVKDVLNERRP